MFTLFVMVFVQKTSKILKLSLGAFIKIYIYFPTRLISLWVCVCYVTVETVYNCQLNIVIYDWIFSGNFPVILTIFLIFFLFIPTKCSILSLRIKWNFKWFCSFVLLFVVPKIIKKREKLNKRRKMDKLKMTC